MLHNYTKQQNHTIKQLRLNMNYTLIHKIDMYIGYERQNFQLLFHGLHNATLFLDDRFVDLCSPCFNTEPICRFVL